MIDQDLVRVLFEYRDGHLYHRYTNNRVKKGARAGTKKYNGYWGLHVYGRDYWAHRVIWIWHYGDIPTNKFIDHISGDRTDNRIENLRLVSPAESNRNMPVKRNSKSGCPGVIWRQSAGKWQVRIKVEGREKSLGYYERLPDAIAVRRTAEPQYGFHKNHGRPLVVQLQQ